jgi:hypothetical protein
MTVVELRKKLEQFGPGREVKIRIELHGSRKIASLEVDDEEGAVYIDGHEQPTADIRFPG